MRLSLIYERNDFSSVELPCRLCASHQLLAPSDLTVQEHIWREYFQDGFSIPFQCPRISMFTCNHVFAINNPSIVTQKVFEETHAGKFHCPFMTPPCESFICPPLALVPKHKKGYFRLIHNLSFPPDTSIISGVDN